MNGLTHMIPNNDSEHQMNNSHTVCIILLDSVFFLNFLFHKGINKITNYILDDR
jgi:hypothetical protein